MSNQEKPENQGPEGKTEQEAVFQYAKQALPLMARYGVKPTPNNYAVWYVYVSGGNDELTREIDSIVQAKMVFSDDLCDYLFTKYIAEDDSRIVFQTTLNMREVIADMMMNLSQFAGETGAYQSALHEQVEQVGGVVDAALSELIKSIEQSTQAMLEKSSDLNHKLIASQREIETLRDDLAKVKVESERDFLTGVYNRRGFNQKLDEQITECAMQQQPLCLLKIDLDAFGAFNDQYGQIMGDEALKIVAKTLIELVKGKDIVARLDADTFMVLLPNTPIGGAMIVAETLRKQIAGKELRHKESQESYGQLTGSVGVVMYQSGDSIPMVMKRADDTVARARKSGGNCVVQQDLT